MVRSGLRHGRCRAWRATGAGAAWLVAGRPCTCPVRLCRRTSPVATTQPSVCPVVGAGRSAARFARGVYVPAGGTDECGRLDGVVAAIDRA